MKVDGRLIFLLTAVHVLQDGSGTESGKPGSFYSLLLCTLLNPARNLGGGCYKAEAGCEQVIQCVMMKGWGDGEENVCFTIAD